MNKRIAGVHMHRGGDFVPAGLLEVVEDGRYSSCRFRYFDAYLERADALAVDPVRLPLHDAVQRVFDGPQGGDLFGGLEDACPDSWGRHVLDVAAEKAGHSLDAVDYLLYAGHERTGALGFSERRADRRALFPQAPWESPGPPPGGELSLEEMLLAADAVDAAEDLAPRYRRFFVRGSSLGGAKPKASVEYEGRAWIAKFGADKEALPSCRLEHASLALARLCGIRTPQTRLLTVFGKRDILLVERFDRTDGARVPFVSALTLLGKSRSEADSPASYADIAQAMRRHCRAGDLREGLVELFSRMLFNICCHNNDDHLRNHGFLHEESDKRGWRLSPAYDVVPQPQDDESAYLHLGVGAKGRAATFENALTGCAAFGLSRARALESITQITGVVAANWERSLREAGVPATLLPRARESFRAVFDEARPGVVT